mgnify:CR=1 FL=1
MSNRYVPPSLMGAGILVVALFAYVVGSTVLGSPADLTAANSAVEAFRNTLWLDRALDVLAQGAVVLSGVMGVVVLLRGIRV